MNWKSRLSSGRAKKVKDVLRRLAPYKPAKVILFGSFSRNESDDVSDMDLLIIKETEEDFFSRIRRVWDLLGLKPMVDVLVYTPAEFKAMKERGNALIETVVEEGLVLYEQPGT